MTVIIELFDLYFSYNKYDNLFKIKQNTKENRLITK